MSRNQKWLILFNQYLKTYQNQVHLNESPLKMSQMGTLMTLRRKANLTLSRSQRKSQPTSNRVLNRSKSQLKRVSLITSMTLIGSPALFENLSRKKLSLTLLLKNYPNLQPENQRKCPSQNSDRSKSQYLSQLTRTFKKTLTARTLTQYLKLSSHCPKYSNQTQTLLLLRKSTSEQPLLTSLELKLRNSILKNSLTRSLTLRMSTWQMSFICVWRT